MFKCITDISKNVQILPTKSSRNTSACTVCTLDSESTALLQTVGLCHIIVQIYSALVAL